MIAILFSKARIYQYLVAILANFSCLNFSFAVAWLSNSVPLLTSEATPLSAGPLSTSEISLIGSIVFLTAIPGSLIFGSLSDRIGRKWSLYIGTFSNIIAFIMIAFAQNFETLVIARALNGIGSGCAFVLVPIFVSEIAEKQIRGILGGIFNAVLNLGSLSTRIICAYVSFHVAPCIFIAINCIFFFGFLLMHDTPQYLLLRGREEEAEASLRFFRGVPQDEEMPEKVREEFEELKRSPTLNNQQQKLTWDDFKPKSTWKAVILCFVIYAGKFLCGVQVVITYLGVIFTQMSFEMDPDTASVIATIIGLPSLFIFFATVESWGRKRIMLASSISTAALFIPLALLARFNDIWHVHDYWGIALLGLVMFTAITGILSMPLQLAAEILPPRLRSRVCSVMMMMAWLGNFILVNFFLSWSENLGLDTLLWLFVIWCIFEGLFLLKFLPETKGKTYDEIAEDF